FHGCLAAIGPLSGVSDRVSQCRLSQFARYAGLIAAKIAKTTSETMHACSTLHSTLQQCKQGHGRLARAVAARKDKIVGATPQRFDLAEDRQRPGGKRHHVIAFRFGSHSRHGPRSFVPVDLVPPRTDDFTSPRGCENEEAKAGGGNGINLAEFGHEGRNVLIVHRPEMLHWLYFRTGRQCFL